MRIKKGDLMNKKAMELTFNTLIVAIIALVVLIVIIAIYLGFIGKSVKDLNGPADQASMGAADAAWCMNNFIAGGCMEITDCSGNGAQAIGSEDGNNCRWTCETSGAKHTIKEDAKLNKDVSCTKKGAKSDRYRCCS